MFRYERKENFIEELRTALRLQTPTERDEEFWSLAQELHTYMSRLDSENLNGFTHAIANGFTIITLVNLYARHAGGLRSFVKKRPLQDYKK